jgi:hypothetical protein
VAAPVDPGAASRSRGFPMAGLAIGGGLIAILAVVGVILSQGQPPSTGASTRTTLPGTQPSTSPAGSAVARGSGSPTTATSGLTLNGGAPLVGVATFRNYRGGCQDLPEVATSPASVRVLGGSIALGFTAYPPELLNGRIAPDNTLTAATPDGTKTAQGTVSIAPSGIRVAGTLSITNNGCTETVDFEILFGAARNTPPAPPGIFIATNTITFGQAATFDPAKTGKEGGTVTFTLKIVGIDPNTPVVEQVTGPGVSSPITFVMTTNVPATKSFKFPPGGGQWTDAVVTIGPNPPPKSAATTMTVVQCTV